MLETYRRALDDLERGGRLRALAPRLGHDFSSNDYLALANSSELAGAVFEALDRAVPVGAGGSRLLRGNHLEHEALEEEAARFFGAQSALYFGGGFPANAALFATLPQKGDLILYDELIHASVHDGMSISRAERKSFLHNDLESLETALKAHRGKGCCWIAVESLYSMDGDLAPIHELMALADRYQAMLVVDEAHATGVLGPDGRGLSAKFEGAENVITLHTCGKALGASGGLLCLARPLRDFMINRARPFIYATAPSPLMAAVVRASLKLCQEQPERRERLDALVTFTGERLRKMELVPSGSQIQPVIVGTPECAVALAKSLQAKGYDIRAIRPPTVPEGTSRLRLAITLHVDEVILGRMLNDLAEALRP
ncbi:MAG: 8-amino-7-oxononanoate synthase [Alphaproteobacteria bacterium]|nr:8-amino-7-oxononanoate synthase [Alphaproteobacteria bacterium]